MSGTPTGRPARNDFIQEIECLDSMETGIGHYCACRSSPCKVGVSRQSPIGRPVSRKSRVIATSAVLHRRPLIGSLGTTNGVGFVRGTHEDTGSGEPLDRGPTDRIVRLVAQGQKIPGSSLVAQAHALAQIGEPPVEVRAGFDPEVLDRVGLHVERADFGERGLVRLVAAIERLGLGRRADALERAGEAVAEFRVEGIGTEATTVLPRGGCPILALLGDPAAEPGESGLGGQPHGESAQGQAQLIDLAGVVQAGQPGLPGGGARGMILDRPTEQVQAPIELAVADQRQAQREGRAQPARIAPDHRLEPLHERPGAGGWASCRTSSRSSCTRSWGSGSTS